MLNSISKVLCAPAKVSSVNARGSFSILLFSFKIKDVFMSRWKVYV